MTEELDFETYLYVSSDKFQIFLFDKKKLINLYKKDLNLNKKFDFYNLENLTKFLDENKYKAIGNIMAATIKAGSNEIQRKKSNKNIDLIDLLYSSQERIKKSKAKKDE